MNTIKTNTALFTLDLIAQCEANLILDMLDAQYKAMFGTKKRATRHLK